MGVDEELYGEGRVSDPPGPGRNGERDFYGEKRSNATHPSSTDPEAQLYKKGPVKEAKLSFIGHPLMENRSGLIVAATVTKTIGTAGRKVRRSPGVRRLALGGDKGYYAASFIADMRALNVTPRVQMERQLVWCVGGRLACHAAVSCDRSGKLGRLAEQHRLRQATKLVSDVSGLHEATVCAA